MAIATVKWRFDGKTSVKRFIVLQKGSFLQRHRPKARHAHIMLQKPIAKPFDFAIGFCNTFVLNHTGKEVETRTCEAGLSAFSVPLRPKPRFAGNELLSGSYIYRQQL